MHSVKWAERHKAPGRVIMACHRLLDDSVVVYLVFSSELWLIIVLFKYRVVAQK